jgi:hypothetical protein
MTIHVCFNILINVVAYLTYVLARSIMRYSGQYNNIVHGI